MIRMIATDLDRTVLMPKQPMPQELFPLIREIHHRGIQFVACSGRQYSNMRRLFQPVANDINYVTTNGAMNLVSNQIIDIHTIPHEDALNICRDIMNAGMRLMVDTKYSVYIFGDDPVYVHEVLYNIRNTTTIMKDLEELPDDIIKISGYAPVDLFRIIQPIAQKWGSRYTATAGGPQWFDVTLSSKAKGLEALCRHFEILPEEIMAFGDSFNDESMLDYVGHPYIISSADPRMKKPNYTIFDSEIDELKNFLFKS